LIQQNSGQTHFFETAQKKGIAHETLKTIFAAWQICQNNTCFYDDEG